MCSLLFFRMTQVLKESSVDVLLSLFSFSSHSSTRSCCRRRSMSAFVSLLHLHAQFEWLAPVFVSVFPHLCV
jgi:hypothetical protein